MKKKTEFITKDISQTFGSSEGAKLYIFINVLTGITEAVLEKTIMERFPIKELDKAQDLYERLTCCSGRKVWTLEEIAHPYNPN